MIVVTFALPEESRAFRALLRRNAAGRWQSGKQSGESGIVVIHTGLGQDAATEAVGALLRTHTPALVVAAGFAGAVDPDLEVGDLVVATNYSDPELLARSRNRARGAGRVFFGALQTVPRVLETCEAKRQLARESDALAVEMETSAIAAECQHRGIPLLALRAISDTASTPLPIPFAASYDLLAQRPRPFGVMLHLLRHPKAALPLARFIRDLAVARAALTAGLITLVSGTDGALALEQPAAADAQS
jgi:nucleoside phosphorylase